MRKFFIVIAMLLSLSGSLAAADERIVAIEIQGNQSASEADIRAMLASRVGDAYSSQKVSHDVRALYESKQFGNVEVRKEARSGGIALIYDVQEAARIEKIEVEGNKKIKDDDLLEDVELKEYATASPAAVNAAIQQMKEKYKKKGYHLATIQPEYRDIPNSPNKILVFKVQEGQGIKIKRITFSGNEAFNDKKLRKVIRTKEKGLLSWLSGSGKYQEEALERDVLFLTYHYLNNGYLKVKVGKPEVTMSEGRWLLIDFPIEEGPAYKVGQVDVGGDILTTQEELKKSLELKSGQVYSRKTVEEDIMRLTELYGNQAYAFANINPATVPHDDTLTADVTYMIEKGSKIKIERINISGNTITRDKVIRRELEVTENSLYHEGRLRRSREKLMALGYFEDVNFATPKGSNEDSVVLNIKVKEKQTGTFSVGAGFSSVENFIVTASIAKDNFLGYGITSRFSLEFSSRRQLFLLSFEDPYFLDTDWIFSASGYRSVNEFEDFDRRSFGGTLGLGRRIFENTQIQLGYQLESVETDDFRTTIPKIFQQNLEGLTSSASLTIARDTRNNRLYPSDGTYLSVSNEFAGLGGDTKFYRVSDNARYYQPLPWKIVFKQNFSIGYIQSLDDKPVPLFERFFTGGVNSLRGFELRSVGPAVRVAPDPTSGDDEFVYGGNKLLLFNSEFEFPLYEPAGLKLVAFYDIGNAFGEDEQYSLTNLRHNYGFGFRWNSPFGPMRFEWGLPINKRAGDNSMIFNFTIGSFF